MGSRAGGAFAICVLVPGLHMVTGAEAADWSITSRLGSTVAISDNAGLRADPLGTSVGISNSASVNISALKPTWNFSLNSNIGHSVFIGPGAPSELGGPSFGTSAAVQKSDKLTQYGLSASVSFRPTAEVELEEDEQVTTSGQTIALSTGATISRQLGPRDSVSAALGWSRAFTDDSDLESSSASFSGSWSHRVTTRTSLGASVSRSQRFSDGDDGDTVVWGFSGQVSSALSARLNVNASAGFSVVEGAGVADLVDNGVTDDGPTIVGPTMSLGLNYALKSTTFSLSASRAITETTFGDLRQSRSIGFSLAHAVNHRANITLTGRHSTSTGGGLDPGERTSRSVLLAYSHMLTPLWNGSLAYRYIDVRRADSFARSNSVVFSINRALTILP